ncbi:GIY-YIG nuclease family protein [Flavobacterium branchiicola]|uniref:GIY-YIG nuclease family protein n=1 Tax=Flavobacterium branchiicola TaxID=1114875 RepID=A0ABV9PEA9_9FLAO|nr:GIY-YIG nuclease family protein [Flavobacterium branchiicola]MBS7255079.1 GIY-YIG nuclease family protein [Flavobacterium branchiicola]
MINHIVYILHSQKLNRYYIGYTSNFDVRLEFHRNSPPNKFTANANDWVLFFSLSCTSKTQALSIERHIKNMKSKVYVENLLKYPEISKKLLEKYTDC